MEDKGGHHQHQQHQQHQQQRHHHHHHQRQCAELTLEYAPGLESFVDIEPHHTLQDVRRLVQDEFDEDMLPPADQEWIFFKGNVRIPTKQEGRQRAWEYLVTPAAPSAPSAPTRSAAPAESTTATLSWTKTRTPLLAIRSKHAPPPFLSQQKRPPAPAAGTGTGTEAAELGVASKRIKRTVASTSTSAFASASTATMTTPLHRSLITPAETTDNDDRPHQRESSSLEPLSLESKLQTPPRSTITATATTSSRTTNDNENGNDHSNFDFDSDATCDMSMDDDAAFSTPLNVDEDDEDEDEDEDLLSDDDQAVVKTTNRSRRARSKADDDDNDDEDEDWVDLEEEDGKPKAKRSASADDDDDDDGHDHDHDHDDADDHDDNDNDADEGDNASGEGILDVTVPANPHAQADQAMDKTRTALHRIEDLLKENELFCTPHRRTEWTAELATLFQSDRPQTIIGVLGNTGVGKSSLLNALLDEAAVLPTSGSRGCTAAVVELVYNTALLTAPEEAITRAPKNKEVAVYRGGVEFMKKEDWNKELRVLLEECSTQEQKIHAVPPNGDTAADAAEAWAKINQVYGAGTMEGFKKWATQLVFTRLSIDRRVTQLLTPTVPGSDYNIIPVEEGMVVPGSDQAKALLLPFAQTRARERRTKKRWATAFRKKINDYVYRKGNGNQPQTWPLIRKVRLLGPWDVLKTGACLVDLPGVRDANAARAKVAQTYLQNCSNIWIVAPIKRAVDDGTAKELLGEQFKRRLLMDGQYGNVSFICTQTDDLEATETMRDHADVAQKVPGRWEQMQELSEDISDGEKQRSDKLMEEEDLKVDLADTISWVKVAKAELREFREGAQDSNADMDDEEHNQLKHTLRRAKSKRQKAQDKLKTWQEDHHTSLEVAMENSGKLQRKLKSICAAVRNEYSKGCLQVDFREGLKEMYRKDGDDGDNADEGSNSVQTVVENQAALPDDFDMDVFCISSNDYLKLMAVKTQSDGPPNTFCNPSDTQIPMLRSYVHETTSRCCNLFARNFVETANDLLDRVKLVASDAKDVPTGRAAFRLKQSFDHEIKKVDAKVATIAEEFHKQLQKRVEHILMPSLSSGAKKGSVVAVTTVNSWGSTNRRTKNERNPNQNGLHWGTYQASVRRDGEYNSTAAGAINMNQELYDPMEKTFSADWQRIMDASTRHLLAKAQAEIALVANALTKDLATELTRGGLEAGRLTTMMSTAKRGSDAAVSAVFAQIAQLSTDSQRELSRSMLPQIQEQMKESYSAAMGVQRGPGSFNRMKHAMSTTSHTAFQSMFDKAMARMKKDVAIMIKQLAGAISAASSTMRRSFESVFSICWDTQTNKTALVDPVMELKVRECQDALLPELNHVLALQNEASELLGIVREELELDVMQVESFEHGLKRKEEEAKKKGNAFNLCDSDTEIVVVPPKPVKGEPTPDRPRVASRPSPLSQRCEQVINLCDSDDDGWVAPRPSGLSKSARKQVRVKSDPNNEGMI